MRRRCLCKVCKKGTVLEQESCLSLRCGCLCCLTDNVHPGRNVCLAAGSVPSDPHLHSPAQLEWEHLAWIRQGQSGSKQQQQQQQQQQQLELELEQSSVAPCSVRLLHRLPFELVAIKVGAGLLAAVLVTALDKGTCGTNLSSRKKKRTRKPVARMRCRAHVRFHRSRPQ